MRVAKTAFRTYQGVVYFPDSDTARAFGERYARLEWPEWRVVEYGRGFAVQLRKSGDYLGKNGRPSMENAMNRLFD